MKRTLFICVCLLISFNCISQQSKFTVYFDFNKSEPDQKYFSQLQDFFKRIENKSINEIIVEGHTDNEGSTSYNKALSLERAKNVLAIIKSFFDNQFEIKMFGFGKENLLTSDTAKQELNRRVEVIVIYKEQTPDPKNTKLIPFFEDVETQNFHINLDDTVLVNGNGGTSIKISPGSITNKKGEIVKGYATFQLKEYYEVGDIILKGLNTVSDSNLLETGGMFNMLIIKEGDTLSDRSLKPIAIRMPLNGESSGIMSVFERNHLDSAAWQNTDSVFMTTKRFWDFPARNEKLKDWSFLTMDYNAWRNGQKIVNDYIIGGFNLFRKKEFKFEAKKITQTFHKLDSSTLQVTLNIRYRNAGLKRHHIREFDTSFIVKYKQREYVGFTYAVNWINCDRFLKFPDVTDFYITTPNYNGASVMAYFKDQKAFLEANEKNEGVFRLSRIPADTRIWIVTFGKKDDVYYFGKKEVITSKNGKTEVDLMPISKDDFMKEIKSF
jgi:OmpA family